MPGMPLYLDRLMPPTLDGWFKQFHFKNWLAEHRGYALCCIQGRASAFTDPTLVHCEGEQMHVAAAEGVGNNRQSVVAVRESPLHYFLDDPIFMG